MSEKFGEEGRMPDQGSEISDQDRDVAERAMRIIRNMTDVIPGGNIIDAIREELENTPPVERGEDG